MNLIIGPSLPASRRAGGFSARKTSSTTWATTSGGLPDVSDFSISFTKPRSCAP